MTSVHDRKGGYKMKNSGVVGIGCFAKPETLARVLKKMIEQYILGNFEGLIRDRGAKTAQSDVIKLLKTIIGVPAASHPYFGADATMSLQNTRITGFFLALGNQGLNLSIFTRDRRLTGKKYTTKLTCLTKIREKRLH
jgi:hypothetical protein